MMNKGFVPIILTLLLSTMDAATVCASEAACPVPQAGSPWQSLQAYRLQVAGLPDPSEQTGGEGEYRPDVSLIGGTHTAESPQGNNSSVELSVEKDLAALHIKTDSAITPYVGAGIGTGSEEEEPGFSNYEAAEVADRQSYQVGAGLGCELSNSAWLNLGYRYSAGSLPENLGTRTSPTEPNNDHPISFGLKLDF